MIENPYVFAEPAYREKFLLHERSELVDRIMATAHAGRDIIISGRPHVGKTSIMYEVRRREQEYITLKLVQTENSFGKDHLKNRIHRSLEEYLQRISAAVELPSPEHDFETYFSTLNRTLATRGQTLVFMLDECTKYLRHTSYKGSPSTDKDIAVSAHFKDLHDIARETTNIRWMLQIHKPTAVYDILARDAAPLLAHYVEYEIPLFTRAQTHQVIQTLGAQCFDFTQDALDLIHDTSEGDPLYAVKMCSYIFKRFYPYEKATKKPLVTKAIVNEFEWERLL
ncbi:hypothetical protein HZC31_07280 [Candidatus Woesearchaeota archaeon]|nr:hypothetical protein [Candidatus Woesearchaeota archaeon]